MDLLRDRTVDNDLVIPNQLFFEDWGIPCQLNLTRGDLFVFQISRTFILVSDRFPILRHSLQRGDARSEWI